MQLEIDRRIFAKFPGLAVGGVVVKSCDNTGVTPAPVCERTAAVSGRLRASLSLEAIAEEPRLAAWRSAYAAFHGEPKKNRSSVESLCRLVLSGRELRSINKLVDIYNMISLEHLLPVGGEDLDVVSGDILLTFAGAAEPAVLLLGDKEPHAPHAGEVIYKDTVSAICRRWNWREADRTKLTEKTANCILVLEGLPPVEKAALAAAAKELAEYVQQYCGGIAVPFMLDEETRAHRL